MGAVIDRGLLAPASNLTVRRVESALAEVSAGENIPTRVDLSGLRHIEIGAGWRIGNAIRAWSSSCELHVELPTDATRGSTMWHQMLTRSGLGLALARSSARVSRQGTDVLGELQDYFPPDGGVQLSRNAVTVPNLLNRGDLRDPSVFAAEFSGEWAAELELESLALRSNHYRVVLFALIREAAMNVHDHAFKSPYLGTPGIGYLSIRRYKKVSVAGDGPLQRYLRSLPPPDGVERKGFVEVVVVDSGSGIAAREAQSAEIYEREVQAEDARLELALEAGHSIKLVTKDAPAFGDPGHGFTYISDGLRQQRAFAELRTGRRLLTMDATLGKESPGFVIQNDVLGYFPGTAFHVVFPIDSDQLILT